MQGLPEAGERPRGTRARLRVLVVDDHELWRSIVRRTLEGAEIEVVGDVGTAEEALELAPRLRPDVILLDDVLPGMRGSDAVRELAPRVPNAAIVMFTAARDDRDVLDALAHGAAGYLTKDISPDALLRAVLAVREGDLPMSRRTASRALRHFMSLAARRGGEGASVNGVALTQRELDVLRRIATGRTNRDIAAELTLSVRTVDSHVAHLLRKLGVRNRAEASHLYSSLLAGQSPTSSTGPHPTHPDDPARY